MNLYIQRAAEDLFGPTFEAAGWKSVPYCDEVYKLAKALIAAIERGAMLEERVHELEKQLRDQRKPRDQS